MARKKRRGRIRRAASERQRAHQLTLDAPTWRNLSQLARLYRTSRSAVVRRLIASRSEEHTSELQSPCNLVCRLLLEKKKYTHNDKTTVPDLLTTADRAPTVRYCTDDIGAA